MNGVQVGIFMTCAVGGVAYAFVYPYLSGANKAEKRQEALSGKKAVRTIDRASDPNSRRKQVADSLKEVEARRSKKLNLEGRIVQAGLKWTTGRYLTVCAVCGVLSALLVYLVDANIVIAFAAAIAGGGGLPLWFLSFRRKRRLNQFLDEFPAAVDIIVRGVKAGLPLADCVRIVANEVKEPVKTEFRVMVETQSLGLSLGEAVERIVERVPLPEASFFSIVINIQQKAGGNLAEALSNLSGVLRDRKKMKGKIKAMSSEAKSSAGIIGALPFLVTGFVYLTSPAYMSLLWTNSTGQMILAGCGLWMAIGVFVMKKMIDFKF